MDDVRRRHRETIAAAAAAPNPPTPALAAAAAAGGGAASRTRNSAASRSGSDSSYYPGCRKDANCSCDICEASFAATRDLIRGRRTPLFGSRTPPPSSPRHVSMCTVTVSPPLESTAKSRPWQAAADAADDGDPAPAPQKATPTEANPVTIKGRSGTMNRATVATSAAAFLVGWLLLWVVNSGLVMGHRATPKLTSQAVQGIGKQAVVFTGDLKGRLLFVEQRMVSEVRAAGVCSCGSNDGNWELIQGGRQFLHWRCTVYKSASEEVSIWGSPVQVFGLLQASLMPRSFALLSGTITEWAEGRLISTLRASSNCSTWTHPGQRTAALQLEPDTWVLEYRRKSQLFPCSGAICAKLGSLMSGIMKMKIGNKLKRVVERAVFLLHESRRQDDDRRLHPT